MEKIRRIFFINRSFFTGVLVFLIAGAFYLLLTSRADSFLLLSEYHNAWLDQFFIYFTNLGDGIFSMIVVCFLVVARKYAWSIQVLGSFLLSGLISQLLKRFIYSPRPKDFFGLSQHHIHIIKDITLGGGASFPSGHSASVFALATSMALFSGNKKSGWLYLLFAVLVGYSRIYLSHHFPKDVFAGAVIGIVSAVAIYLIIERFRISRIKKGDAGAGKDEQKIFPKNSLSFNRIVLTSTYDLQ